MRKKQEKNKFIYLPGTFSFYKRYKNCFGYRFRFVYQFTFIFFQLTIFFFLAKFIDISSTGSITNNDKLYSTFAYFVFGICFLDISYVLISSSSIQIEEFKRSGALEEIFILPINFFAYFLSINIYPLILSLFKFIVYIICISFVYKVPEIDLYAFLLMILALFMGLLCFIFISIIACSITLLFYRGTVISAVHNLYLLFLAVFFPISIINEKIHFIQYFIPIFPLLEIFRGQYHLTESSHCSNISILITNVLLYGLLSYILLIYRLKKQKKMEQFRNTNE